MGQLQVSIPVLLQEIQTNNEFCEDMKESFPEIEDSISRYKKNPLCKCRKEIHSFFMRTVTDKKLVPFINKWKGKTKVSLVGGSIEEQPEVTRRKQKSGPRTMHGEVIEIPAEPQAYKKLISHALEQKWEYNTLSVLEKEKDGQTVWLIFFG